MIDYGASIPELVERGPEGWLRTYREHGRGGLALETPGEQDITIDVPTDDIVRVAVRAGLAPDLDVSQAEWLGGLGIDELTEQARVAWQARAHIGDLEAIRHRSRVGEAAALTDPVGLGAHRVLVFRG